MRKLCFLALISLFFGEIKAQLCDYDRYETALFAVDTTEDIVYGNAPAMPAVYINENVTVPQDLTLDLYEPAGDTLSKRPLLLFAFGGGFLIGSKEDEDARSVCDSFARKGYVCASINYRLNLNVLDNSSAERAVFRAVQDWSAAVRYFKEFADSFRIDTNWIFAGGVSAGSISAMHLQYMSEAQRPASSFAQGPPFSRPDLGCKDCEGNNYAHSSSVKALINCWGAIGDTLWIDAQDSVPMISFHGTIDPVVPYGFGLPFTALLTMPPLYGSSLIHARQNNVGLANDFVPFPGEGHNVWGTVVANEFVPGATQHWEPILSDIHDFLWEIVKPETGNLGGAITTNQNDVETYSVPFEAGNYWCWDVQGGTIVSANPWSHTVDIRWDQVGVQTVEVRAMRCFDAAGDVRMLQVQVGPAGLEDGLDAGFEVAVDRVSEVIRVEMVGEWEAAEVEIVNVAGQVMGEMNCAGQCAIGMENRSRGVYFVRVVSGEKMGVRRIFW
ncbi:MAG: alpha/beta hydrolase [Bacteroidota bacterium]